MLDLELGAKSIEFVVASRGPLAQAEQPVRPLLSVVRQHAGDLHRGGNLYSAGTRERWPPSSLGSSARRPERSGAVYHHEQIPTPIFVRHPKQVLHVDIRAALFVGLEGVVGKLRRLRPKIPQQGYAMPAQTAIKYLARDVLVEELAHHGQQVVERQQQRLALAHEQQHAVARTLRDQAAETQLGRYLEN